MCEEYTLNILHNGGEKKGKKVDPKTFTLEVSPDHLRKLNYVQYQLGSLVCELQENEGCYALARSAHGTLNDVIVYLENQTQKARSQKG